MLGSLNVGSLYTREAIAEIVDLPQARRKGGNWATGYDEWNGAAYIFANVGVPGRTGHDYPNRWSGKSLVWYGKSGTRRGQAQIDRLISNAIPVHLFWRGDSAGPFTYAGDSVAIEASDGPPVRVVWSFHGLAPGTPIAPAAKSRAKMRRGPKPAKGLSTTTKEDGPTDLYVARLHGPVRHLLDVSDGHVVVKIGITNNIEHRLGELSFGFPPGSRCEWRLEAKRTWPDADTAWAEEGKRLERLRLAGLWIGGEFAIVPETDIPGLLDS